MSTPTASSQFETVVVCHSNSHVDRNSAIALGILLLLILAAVAYCVHVRLKARRQVDLERQERRATIHTLRHYGARGRAATPSFRIERFCSKDSHSTLRGGIIGQTGKKGSWSSSSEGSVMPRLASFDMTRDTLHPSDEQGRSRSSSPRSDVRRCSHHRRSHSISSLSTPLLSSLQHQSDGPYGIEAAQRRSTTHANRRFTVLEPIHEPGAVRISESKRRRSEAGWGRTDQTESGGYDWTRPSVSIAAIGCSDQNSEDGVINRGRGNTRSVAPGEFGHVMWDAKAKGKGVSHQAGATGGVERVDWAHRTSNLSQ